MIFFRMLQSFNDNKTKTTIIYYWLLHNKTFLKTYWISYLCTWSITHNHWKRSLPVIFCDFWFAILSVDQDSYQDVVHNFLVINIECKNSLKFIRQNISFKIAFIFLYMKRKILQIHIQSKLFISKILDDRAYFLWLILKFLSFC